MNIPQVLHVCTGRAQPLQAADGTVLSGIRKAALAGPVAAHPLGLQGDEQADRARPRQVRRLAAAGAAPRPLRAQCCS